MQKDHNGLFAKSVDMPKWRDQIKMPLWPLEISKELGMTLVPIKIDEDLQDENSKLRALISNNFGRRKNNPAKDR